MARKKFLERKHGASTNRDKTNLPEFLRKARQPTFLEISQSIASCSSANQPDDDVEVISSSPEGPSQDISSPSSSQDQCPSGSMSPVFVPTPVQEIVQCQSETKTREVELENESSTDEPITD